MALSNTTNPIADAQARIAHLDHNRAEILSALAAVKARRSQAFREAFLHGPEPSKPWIAAVAHEAQAVAMLADVEALYAVLKLELIAAEAQEKSAADRAWMTAFRLRLGVVIREQNITVSPADADQFEGNVLKSYRWLSTIYRTAAVDKSRHITHWMDELTAARFGNVTRAEFMSAVFMHGDIIVQDGGQDYNLYIAISVYSGRAADSVPLDGHPTPPIAMLQVPAVNPAPILINCIPSTVPH